MHVYVSPRLVFIWEPCPRSLWKAFIFFLLLLIFSPRFSFFETRTVSSYEVQIKRDFSFFLFFSLFASCSAFVESIVYERHDRQIVATARL